eukprot:gene20521-22540_t
MDKECCEVLQELLGKASLDNSSIEEDDIGRFVNYVLDPRQCRCQLQIDAPKESLQLVIETFIKHAIGRIKQVSHGYIASTDAKSASELDSIFQALTKLFQVHFFLTDRGKNLQSGSTVRREFVWKYCNVAQNEEAPSQMLENVAMFCEFGGLDAVSECFSSKDSEMPVSLASCLISIIAQLRIWMTNEAIKENIKTLATPVLSYLCNLPEDEIRMPNTRAMADLMLSTVKFEDDGEPKIDFNVLELSFIYFMSSTLTVRMEGLNQITNQIHNLIELSHTDGFGDIDALCQELANWLIEKDMIEHLFGPNHHIELLKQSQFLLNFLAQEKQLKPKHLECVWNAAQLKHTGKFVLDLLISLTKHMELKSIQCLLTLVGRLLVGSHTKQTLLLASLLTRRVWSATLYGSKMSDSTTERSNAVGVQVKKRINVSPARSPDSASVSSDGSTDDDVASNHGNTVAGSDARGDDVSSRSLDFKMPNLETSNRSSILPNAELLDVSPRDFDDSDDVMPISSSFQSDQADGDTDEDDDEMNYLNVSPVSEERAGQRQDDTDASEEEEDQEVANLVNSMSSPKARSDLEANNLCLQGNTLLWDLLQDENIDELGEGMIQEVQKLLWQLVRYTGNRDVVMAFVKGCLNNIEHNRSVVISFQILPKILNSYPMSSNSSDGHWLLEWAVKDLHMMDVFFSNLKDFVELWQQKVTAREGDNDPTPHREQQILARLEFLTALYSSELSPDHFRLTITQVDCLWSSLVTEMSERFHYLLLSWLLKQANSKDLHALGLDAFKHIFMNKLPEMNPETITFTGLGLFQQLFNLTRLSNASPFAQETQDEEILGIDYLWKIALKAQRDQVADEAMGYLNYLYITIGNGSLEKEREFLIRCVLYLKRSMTSLSKETNESLRTIQQILTILKSHLEAYWKRFTYHIHMWQLSGYNFEGHQPRIRSTGSKEQPLRVLCQPAGFSEKACFRLSSYDLLAKLRAEITHWCVKLQSEHDEKERPQVAQPLQPPFRLISHGHELTPDLDHKALGELGIKDQQLIFVSVSHPRKDRLQNGSQVPASLQRSPDMDASPMVQLLKEDNFSLFFNLLDLLHKTRLTKDNNENSPSHEPREDKNSSNASSSDGPTSINTPRYVSDTRKDITTKNLVHSLWELLMILPTNTDIKRRLEKLEEAEDKSSESTTSCWAELLVTDSMFRLLYVLHIIDSMSAYDQDVLHSTSQDHDASTDSDSGSSESEHALYRSSVEPVGWVKKFIKLGGLRCLYDRLFSDSLSTRNTCSDDWTLNCIGYVMKLLTRFGCISLAREEKEDVVVVADRESKRRRTEHGKQRKHVLRARYKSIEGDNVVIIQGFNQSLVELVKEDVLLEKLISLLCGVSECPNQFSAGSQDVHAAVVYHCLSFLVCWTQMDNQVTSSLVHHEKFEVLLQRLIFESPQKSVRTEASRGIFKMCVSVETDLLNMVLNLLLRNLPTLIACREGLIETHHSSKSATSNFKDYFWLLSRLIDKHEVAIDAANPVDIEKAVATVAEFICGYAGAKEAVPSSDYCLIGLLHVCTSLLRHEPVFKYSDKGRKLMKNVFNDCLFRIPLDAEDGENGRPTCETKTARGAAFDLLVKLAQGCDRNYRELQALFFKHHAVDDNTGAHSSYGWNYWPHELERSPAGYVGLVNLGATCYMASCVQQLFMIPKARAALLQAKASDNMKFGLVLKELQKMFAYLQESYRKAYNPRSLCKTYTMDKQPLNTGEQKDMAEFFTDLISKLEEMDDNLKCTMRDLFCGVITNNVVSLDCDHVSKTEEEFYSVRCTVADMRNLYESLDEETVKDVLEGDNKYTCSQCQEKVRAEKRACFKKLPKVLCFNTMRYTFNMVTMMKEKVNTHFSFPMRLNMAPYTEEYLMQNKDQDPDDDPRYWYNLAGVVVHTGTADGGHYYSFIRDRHSKSGNWYLFNDAEVKPFDPSQIAAECFGGEMMTKTYDAVTEKYMDVSFEKTHSAYMLFYEHVSMDVEKQPERTVRLCQDLQEWIWHDNVQFLRDKLVFDVSYFNFMWQFCNVLPSSIDNSLSVGYFSIKLGASFLLETLVHSREKPHMKGWMEFLLNGLDRCQPACEWLLETMAADDWWLQQMFVKCPAQPLRQMFGQICLHAIKILRPSQVDKYSQASDDDSDNDEDDEDGIGSASPTTRFIKTALALLEENIRSHCKNLGELFHFIYQFVSLGQEECNFMLNIDAITTMVNFYMGLKASEVADMTCDDDDDMDIDDEDILSIFPEERYNPSALEKMISTLAVLLDEAREDRQLQLSQNDYTALTGERGFPFLYQITKDAINLKQTANIISSLCLFNQGMAEKILEMIILSIQKLQTEQQSQHFFRLLSLLTEHDTPSTPGLLSFTNLILPKMAQVAENSPGLYIDWLTSQVPRNKIAHRWVLHNMSHWVEKYLIADSNPRIRNGAAFLLVSLVPNPHFPQAFRARGFAQPQKEWKMSQETKVVLHKIYVYLLELLKGLRKYCDASQNGTTKLVSFFSILNYCLVSQEEKLMFTPYSMDLWKLFHPAMTEPDIPIHFNKQALLTFWFHVCINCEDNIKFLTDTSEVSSNIAYNYILSNDEADVISYNRNCLPVYYGLLRLACQYSPQFCQTLSNHRNMTWAFKHLAPRVNQYPQAVEELFSLLNLFANRSQSEENQAIVNEFRAKAVALFSTCIDGQSAWTTLISTYKILLQSEEDLLVVATNKGLHTLSEAFVTLFVMYYEATACNVEDDIAEILQILFTVLNCCSKFRDRQEVKRGLLSWKERRDVMQKLGSMLNSYSTKKIRQYGLDLLTIMLVIYNEDAVDTMAPIIYQSHVSIASQQTPPVCGLHFPRRSNKPLPRKLSLAPRIPELNMVVHPGYIETQRGVDSAYDQALTEYYQEYHQFVDKLCRFALNADQVPLVIIEISCILGVEAIPLRFNLFPKLWLEVKNKSHENLRFKNCIEKLIQCEPFIEYIDVVFADHRECLSSQDVYSFMLQFLPKVHQKILGAQKQPLVNTVVSKLIADCTMLKDESDEGFQKSIHRLNGDIRSLTLLFVVSSPNELTVGSLLQGSLQKLLERCNQVKHRIMKEKMAETREDKNTESGSKGNDKDEKTEKKSNEITEQSKSEADVKDTATADDETPKEPPSKKPKHEDINDEGGEVDGGEIGGGRDTAGIKETDSKIQGNTDADSSKLSDKEKRGEGVVEKKRIDNSEEEGNIEGSSKQKFGMKENEKDSRSSNQENLKSSKSMHPVLIDILRKSTNELLHCLQRYYDSK